MGKFTISMVIFNSYVSHHQRVSSPKPFWASHSSKPEPDPPNDALPCEEGTATLRPFDFQTGGIYGASDVHKTYKVVPPSYKLVSKPH